MPKMTNLATLRQERGVSKRKLAAAVGVSRTTILKLEAGETEEPSYGLTMEIARELQVAHELLFLPAGTSKLLQEADA